MNRIFYSLRIETGQILSPGVGGRECLGGSHGFQGEGKGDQSSPIENKLTNSLSLPLPPSGNKL